MTTSEVNTLRCARWATEALSLVEVVVLGGCARVADLVDWVPALSGSSAVDTNVSLDTIASSSASGAVNTFSRWLVIVLGRGASVADVVQGIKLVATETSADGT